MAPHFLLSDYQPPVVRVVPLHHPRHVRRQILRAREAGDWRRVLPLRRLEAPDSPVSGLAAVERRVDIRLEIGAALDTDEVRAVHGNGKDFPIRILDEI